MLQANFFRLLINRLCSLREFCTNDQQVQSDKFMKNLILKDDEWIEVELIRDILAVFNKYTVLMQSKVCTLSDFFGYWQILLMKTKKVNHSLADKIVEHMENRRETLMNNPMLLGAVFLDPRYQRALSSSQKDESIHFLKHIYDRILKIEGSPSVDDSAAQGSTDLTDIEEYLKLFECVNSSTAQKGLSLDIECKLREFNGTKTAGNTNILAFWQSKKDSDPEMYKLAYAVYIVPATQTTVERLVFILSSLSYSSI